MRMRAAIAAVVVCTAILPLGLGPVPRACAAGGPHAALVVSTGSKVYRYCVALDALSVSGLHVIELAHDQHGLTYRSDGAALCMLAGVGPEQGTCFGGYPNFWGYWRGDGSGGWSWAGEGAASTVVRSGAVEGWAWGSGDDGATHPRPPGTTLTSVCATPSTNPTPTPAASPRSTPTPPPTPSRSPSAAPTSVSSPLTPPSPARSNHLTPRDDRRRSRHRHKENVGTSLRPRPSRRPPMAPGASRSPAVQTTSATGPPAAGVASLVVAAALICGGWIVLRRRHLRP
jgi:hypothetical protein